jgi:hypothetical protein
MLEPALNLARLQIRAENGDRALRLLDSVYQAVTTHVDLVVDERTLPLADVVGTRQEYHKLREWVWLQYLAEGIRVLAMAGRWEEAVTHARAHNGIGAHLMEGRQTEIIACCLHGSREVARTILDASELTQPWERQVGACLNVMCSSLNGQDVTTMAEQFFGNKPVPGYVVFRTRFGLTAATLAGATDPVAANRVLTQVAAEVIESGDGYAARDVLGYRSTVTRLTGEHHEALASLVTAAGLGSGALPEPLLDSLTTSAKLAGETLARSVRQ